jgi:hypothetical protein
MMTGEGFTDRHQRERNAVCDCGNVTNHCGPCDTCQQPGCEATVCSECRKRCECCPKERLCPAHVSLVDGVDACVSCEARDMSADELMEREAA